MSAELVVNNLGTIANTGTRALLVALRAERRHLQDWTVQRWVGRHQGVRACEQSREERRSWYQSLLGGHECWPTRPWLDCLMVGVSTCTRQSTEAFGTSSHSTFSRCSCALFAHGKLVQYFHSALVSYSIFFSVWVLFGITRELDFGGEDAVHGSFWKNLTHIQREVHAPTCLAASDDGRLFRRKTRPFFPTPSS